MFNLKSLKSALTSNQSMKVVASNNFLSSLNEAKAKVEVSEKNNDDKYNIVFHDAMMNLNVFTATEGFDAESFNAAADGFAEATKIKSNRAEPYFYLAWMFDFIGEINDAVKYLKIARYIDPNLEGIKDLAEEITSKQLKMSEVKV